MSLTRTVRSLNDLLAGSARAAPVFEDGAWAARALPRYDAREGGARFDGSADDSANIQSVIDALAAVGGGIVEHPSGLDTMASIVLKSGVYYVGGGRGYLASPVVNPGKITAVAAGAAIDTPLTYVRNCGVIGVNLAGLGAATAGQAIRFRDVTKGVVRFCSVNNFADQGILLDATSGGCLIEANQATNCLLNRTRAQRSGTIEILGTDHWVLYNEGTIGGTVGQAVTDANLYCAGMLIGMTNGVTVGNIGEISDVGIYITGDYNKMHGDRGDLNSGHGVVVSGARNQITNLQALNNSQAANNTYDSIWFESGSSLNQTTNLSSDGINANKHRYGIVDDVAGATTKNTHVNPQDLGAVTQKYKGAASNGSSWHFPAGGPKTLTADSTTPDVSGYTVFATANTVDTVISDFLGGVPGQRIVVRCADATSSKTTIAHNGSTISHYNAGNKKLRRLAQYEYQFSGSAWFEIAPAPIGMSADNGDAAKTLQYRRDEETQEWDTPLTADRAATLSTTGAASGAEFHISRTANATGASSLNVGTGPLKALAAGQWCIVRHNGTAWRLVAFGSL